MPNLRSLRICFHQHTTAEQKAILDFQDKFEQCGYPNNPTGNWLKRKMGQRLDDSISKWLDDGVKERGEEHETKD